MSRINIIDVPKLGGVNRATTLYANHNGRFVQTPIDDVLQMNELPIVDIWSDDNDVFADTYVWAHIRFRGHNIEFEQECQCKIQGNSTKNAPLKNIKIKLSEPIEFENWGKRDEFVLKADWADPNRNRNVCCAKLWAQVCEAYPDDEPDFLKNAINHGAIDGFPFLLSVDQEPLCLYNWTIPKFQSFSLPDGVVAVQFSTNSNGAHLNSEGLGSDANIFLASIGGFEGKRSEFTSDECDLLAESFDWSTEDYSLKMKLLDMIERIVRTVWAGSYAGLDLQKYFCVPQLLRYYVFTWFIRNLDGWNKNMILVLYHDKFYPVPYDLDLTLGINLTNISDITQGITLTYGVSKEQGNNYYEPNSMLWKGLCRNYMAEIYNLYEHLYHQFVLHPGNILKTFYTDYEAKYRNLPGIHTSCLNVDAEEAGEYLYSGYPDTNMDYQNFSYTTGGVTGS